MSQKENLSIVLVLAFGLGIFLPSQADAKNSKYNETITCDSATQYSMPTLTVRWTKKDCQVVESLYYAIWKKKNKNFMEAQDKQNEGFRKILAAIPQDTPTKVREGVCRQLIRDFRDTSTRQREVWFELMKADKKHREGDCIEYHK